MIFRFENILRRVVCSSAFVFCFSGLPSLAQEQQITLTVEQSRAVAQQALANGDIELAEALAKGLLQRDTRDPLALYVLGSVLIRKGKPQDALILARRAFRLLPAKDKVGKHATAVLAARALNDLKRHEQAKLWVRRSVQFAPSEEIKQARIREFQTLRQISPWQTQLSFSINPSDNVNNGTDAEYILIGGLPFTLNDTTPLKGYTVDGSAKITYRLSQSQTEKWTLGADIYHRFIVLESGESEKTTLSASDFNYTYLGGRLIRQSKGKRKNSEHRETLSFGRAWYGGDPLSDQFSFQKSYTEVINPNTRAGVSLSFTRVIRDGRSEQNSSRVQLSIPITRVLPNKAQLTVQPFYQETKSEANSVAHKGYGAVLNYAPAKGVYDIKPSFTFGVTKRKDNDFHLGTLRNDDGYFAEVQFLVPQISIYGFSPSVSLTARRNKSNSVLNDTKQLNARVEFQSSF